jgi:hypothetical protein
MSESVFDGSFRLMNSSVNSLPLKTLFGALLLLLCFFLFYVYIFSHGCFVLFCFLAFKDLLPEMTRCDNWYELYIVGLCDYRQKKTGLIAILKLVETTLIFIMNAANAQTKLNRLYLFVSFIFVHTSFNLLIGFSFKASFLLRFLIWFSLIFSSWF